MADPVGYCGVILEAQNEFQGLFIYTSPELEELASNMEEIARSTTDGSMRAVLAALEAVAADSVTTGRQELIAPAILAIRRLHRADYFYIKATPIGDGIVTDLFRLESCTVEDARDKINTLPEVQAIKKRLMADLLRSKKH